MEGKSICQIILIMKLSRIKRSLICLSEGRWMVLHHVFQGQFHKKRRKSVSFSCIHPTGTQCTLSKLFCDLAKCPMIKSEKERGLLVQSLANLTLCPSELCDSTMWAASLWIVKCPCILTHCVCQVSYINDSFIKAFLSCFLDEALWQK